MWGVIGGFALISAVIHAYTLWRSQTSPDIFALNAQVLSLKLEVTDLIDRVDSWQRRDKTRAARERKAEVHSDTLEAELPSASNPKELLRRKVYNIRGG